MSPVIVLRDGKPVFALGLPGGLRIFASVMQALINLIDHGMSAAGGGGGAAPLDPGLRRRDGAGIRETCVAACAARGHDVSVVPQRRRRHVRDRLRTPTACWTGAACWRADGTPIGLGGGLARPGVRFRPEAATQV